MGRAFVGCVFHLEYREVSNGRGKFYTGAIAVKGYGRPLGGRDYENDRHECTLRVGSSVARVERIEMGGA